MSVQSTCEAATPAHDGTIGGMLTSVAAGDRSAFADLYTQFESRVFGLCFVLLRERQQAEEVAQEVFLHVWQRASSFDATRGGGTAWILRLARSKAIDRIRHSQASRVRDGQYAQNTHLPDTDSVVEEVFVHADRVAVHEALERLSDKQRQAVVLSYYRGMTSPQISDVLGVPVSTIKTRIRDGLAKLGTFLTESDFRQTSAA